MWEVGIFSGRDLGARGVEDIAVGWRAMLVAANLKARKRGGVAEFVFGGPPYDWATWLTEFSRVLNKLNNRPFQIGKREPPALAELVRAQCISRVITRDPESC